MTPDKITVPAAMHSDVLQTAKSGFDEYFLLIIVHLYPAMQLSTSSSRTNKLVSNLMSINYSNQSFW